MNIAACSLPNVNKYTQTILHKPHNTSGRAKSGVRFL